MKYFLGVAEEEGLTEEEIGAVEAIVMAVSACRIRTQLADARSKPGVGCGQTAAASPPAGATGAVSVGMWPRLDDD